MTEFQRLSSIFDNSELSRTSVNEGTIVRKIVIVLGSNIFLFSIGPFSLKQFEKVALLVTDPPHANSTNRQNAPIYNPPFYITMTTELFMKLNLFFLIL